MSGLTPDTLYEYQAPSIDFGGTPATVGANQGNGTDFFLVGRFDQAGNAYDGPGGANDGVDGRESDRDGVVLRGLRQDCGHGARH